MDVPWLMAAPVDTEVIPSLLRPLWLGVKNLTDLSVKFIPGNQFVWPIMTIKRLTSNTEPQPTVDVRSLFNASA